MGSAKRKPSPSSRISSRTSWTRQQAARRCSPAPTRASQPPCNKVAVDAEGEVLDVLVQSKRNKHAAPKLMRKLLKNPSPAEARLLATETELISCRLEGSGR